MNNSPATPQEMLLRHEGEIPLAKSEELFEAARGLVAKGEIPRAAFRVFLELVQNIRLHGGAAGVVSIGRAPGFVVITAQNSAPQNTATQVLEAVAYANLHAGNIASVLREIRKSPVPNGANGAGLGIFEIRRLASRDVEASVLPGTDGNSELVIRVTVPHNTTP